jgi:hypothetical protein
MSPRWAASPVRRKRAAAVAMALLPACGAGRAAAGDCSNEVPTCATATADPAGNGSPLFNFFGDTSHRQTTADQVSLSSQSGPLPVTISGNVQRWTSGPPLQNLYTQAAQGLYRINDQWKLLGQELYQQQGSINLLNVVGGFNYQPNDDFNINVTAGVGDHTLYTYRWSTYISPQYRLPWELYGRRRVAIEAATTFENYELGNFYQLTPKLDLDLADWLPQLQIGYAFGNFGSTGATTTTQYYQPQTVRGLTITAVAHPLQDVYIVASYLPANRNYIAGNYVVQDTVAATVHWNVAGNLRLAAYAEKSWYQGGSYRALGGGVSFAF